MMLFLIIISWSAMDGHSKREMLEIFNMNKKKVIARFLFKKTGHLLVNNLRLFVKWSCDISRDWLAQYLYFKMLKAMSSFLCSKFWFSAIIYADVVANKPFSTDKPLDCSQSLIFIVRSLRYRASYH